MFKFEKAQKKQVKLRMAIYGPSGSGKTASALRIAHGMGGKIALLDTEHYSASRYADGVYDPNGNFFPFDFDVVQLDSPQIDMYVQVIQAAEAAGYATLIIDSLSHGWQELLMQIDKLTNTKYKGNSWQAWSEGTPLQKKLVGAITRSKMHVIATMRAKTEWETTKDERSGKTKPVRIGLAPEQGKGIEYEFDMLMEINDSHMATIIKDRSGKFQGAEILFPDENLGKQIAAWIGEGDTAFEYPEPKAEPEPSKPAQVSMETIQARAMLKDALKAAMLADIDGYKSAAKIKADMKALLGVDHIDKTTDAHIEDMEAWRINIEKRMAGDIPQPEPQAEPNPEPEPVITPPPAAPKADIDYQAILSEIDTEITRRSMSDSIARHFIDSASDMAARGSESIANILESVKSYPLKPAETTDDIANLHSEVSRLIKVMITDNIDDFSNSARMAASLNKHLETKKIKDCADAEKLAAYIIHLQAKIINYKGE